MLWNSKDIFYTVIWYILFSVCNLIYYVFTVVVRNLIIIIIIHVLENVVVRKEMIQKVNANIGRLKNAMFARGIPTKYNILYIIMYRKCFLLPEAAVRVYSHLEC